MTLYADVAAQSPSEGDDSADRATAFLPHASPGGDGANAAPTPDQALIDWVVSHPLCRALCDDALNPEWATHLQKDWMFSARNSQRPPQGDWRVWMMMAGRGFGKTRAGAEWVDALARANPRVRIALVGATMDDVRHVMVEGESGIMNLCGSHDRPIYAPALRRILWPNGAMAACYSAAEPESLRGPQHHYAWADEVARWGAGGMRSAGSGAESVGGRAVMAWDNLMLGLRLGNQPQVVATTTPRAVPLVERILKQPKCVVTGGATSANAAHLPPAFIEAMEANYGGTLLGRQELGGELIAERPGALWSRALLERCRTRADAIEEGTLVRVVVAVDPPASDSGDGCGIVVAAQMSGDAPHRFVVLADATVERCSPAQWARAVAVTSARWCADVVVAEANNGGHMVREVLLAADGGMPVRLVHASAHKGARAEPISLLYEQGRVAHRGVFPALEDQLCGLMPGGQYMGPGRSPDRADALVWALSALKGSGAEPRVRGL